MAVDGCVDYAVLDAQRAREREYYDTAYGARGSAAAALPFDEQWLTRRWQDRHWPECQLVLERLGDLKEKIVVCIGNGASLKELYFLHRGAYLIDSDLSIEGPRRAKRHFDLSRFDGRYAFHAFDAYRMPLANASVDVVYAFELVHHLPDLGGFFDEIFRVLKPGGKCVFYDHAYSRVWQAAKLTVLRPLMKLVHRYHGISPEDLRATYQGGYREEDLARWATEHGFAAAFSERTTFFHYLVTNGVGKVIGWSWPLWMYKGPGLIGRALDATLTRNVRLLRDSRIEMVWGFQKS